MAVYVDAARNRLGRLILCHMLADTDEELHAMAAAIGMKREWFQPLSHPHYDVSLTRRKLAVALGAIEVDRRGIVAVMRSCRKNKNGCSQRRLDSSSEEDLGGVCDQSP